MDQPAALKPTARSEGRSLGRFLRRPLGRPLGSEGAPPDGKPRDTTVAGIVYANMSVLTFTLMDAIIKDTSRQFPTGEIIFFRNLFAFIPLLAFAWWRHGGVPLKTSRPWGHVMRGVFGVASMFCFFLSYKLMPLSDAIALGLSGPIFITVLSVPVLGEQVGWRRWSAVIVGFIGVLVMTRPGSTLFDVNALVPLAAAILYAAAMISIRKLGATEPPTTIVFHFTAFATLASLLTIPWGDIDPEQAWVMPSGWSQLGILIVGDDGDAPAPLAQKLSSGENEGSFSGAEETADKDEKRQFRHTSQSKINGVTWIVETF